MICRIMVIAALLGVVLGPDAGLARVFPLLVLYADQMTGAPPPPVTAYSLAEQGYKAYAAGDYGAAAAAFERALAIDPNQPDLAAQLAYTLKTLGDNRAAARWFRHAISHTHTEVDYRLRREVAILENRFDMSGYIIWRENALDGGALAAAGPSLTQSQGGTELSWTPPRVGLRNGRRLQLFARFLWGFEGDTLKIQDDSHQAGLGARYRPLKAHNLVITAERLMGIGDFARDNWMLRSSYSWDRGYGYEPGATSWDYVTFYA
ncbi:MAG: hypothetical protein D6763_09550, partial [Alphaproteobacteria bacterium]